LLDLFNLGYSRFVMSEMFLDQTSKGSGWHDVSSLKKLLEIVFFSRIQEIHKESVRLPENKVWHIYKNIYFLMHVTIDIVDVKTVQTRNAFKHDV